MPEGTPILAGGIGVARLVGGAVFCLFVCLFVCLGKFLSVLLLVTRLGLMPCSAWSKKNWARCRAALEVKKKRTET